MKDDFVNEVEVNLMANKVAVITGGGHGIGKAIADAFRDIGVEVHIIDIKPGDWFVGDVADKETLEAFAQSVIEESGHVDFLINNALPVMKGIDECSYEEFQYALSVGVTAPFYLTKLFMPYFAKRGLCNKHCIFKRPDEPASDRELFIRERWYCSSHSFNGNEPCG